MRQAVRLSEATRTRNLLSLRNPASALPRIYAQNATCRRLSTKTTHASPLRPFPLSSFSSSSRDQRSIFLPEINLPPAYQTFTSATLRLQEQRPREEAASGGGGDASSADQNKSDKSEQESQGRAGNKSQSSSEQTGDGRERRKQQEDEPPTPPHGNKSPWQVFTETLQSEFKASKEWNESTKAIASSAHQFTENESVKRARAAYTAASGAATSTTSSALKSTGKVIGQSAAWTWETPVVKGVRSGVNATGRGIEKVTRPVRETQVYKTAVGGVKDVIDDGSSSRYGGWVEKEERRKQKELRELKEATQSGRHGKRVEKMEEDPK